MVVAYFVFVSILVIASQLLEIYSYILKGIKIDGYSRQLIGYAGFIHYFGRIIYVVVLMILSYLFEVENVRSDMNYIFLFSFLTSLAFVFCVLNNNDIYYFFQRFVRLLSFFSYRNIKEPKFHKVEFSITCNRVFIFSYFSSFCITLAFVAPFIAAQIYPEYRMLATYSGQAMNFAATAIVLAVIEPVLFNELDSQKKEFNGMSETAVLIINAKICSLFSMVAVMGVLIYLGV